MSQSNRIGHVLVVYAFQGVKKEDTRGGHISSQNLIHQDIVFTSIPIPKFLDNRIPTSILPSFSLFFLPCEYTTLTRKAKQVAPAPLFLRWRVRYDFEVVRNDDSSQNHTMGIQSQLRNGAVKACKKRVTKLKCKRRVQSTIHGGVAFIAAKNCKICVAQTKVKSGVRAHVPHRSHHKLCPKNRKTQGLKSDMTVYFENEMAKNIAINNAPIVPMPFNPNRLRNSDHFFGSFAGHQTEAATTVKQVNSFNKSTSSDHLITQPGHVGHAMTEIPNGGGTAL